MPAISAPSRKPPWPHETNRSIRANGIRERVARNEQAHDKVRLAREIEKVAGMHEDPFVAAADRVSAAPRSCGRARGRQPTSRPPHGAPRRRAHRAPAGEGWQGCPESARGSRGVSRVRLASRSDADACIGVPTDRNVSATTSSASRAARRSSAGPPTISQPSFSCGRPSDFDAPASVNVSTSERSGGQIGHRRFCVERIVGEHLVRDERPSVLTTRVDQSVELRR